VSSPEVSEYLVGSAAFKAVGMGDPHPAGSIPVHLRQRAQFVGHANVSTTRGYVQHEGERPRQVSEKAFLLLDPRPPHDADGDDD